MVKEIDITDINSLKNEEIISKDEAKYLKDLLEQPTISGRVNTAKIHLQLGRVLIKVYQYDANTRRYYVAYTTEIKNIVDRNKLYKVLNTR